MFWELFFSGFFATVSHQFYFEGLYRKLLHHSASRLSLLWGVDNLALLCERSHTQSKWWESNPLPDARVAHLERSSAALFIFYFHIFISIYNKK